jgi:hypothetical protein
VSRWPSGRPGDEEVATAVPAPAVAVDLSAMLPEQVHARSKELEDGLRAARRERDEAGVEVAAAKGRLVEAAGRGFEAAKAAQRAIGEANERFLAAQCIVEAVEAAARPFATEAHRLRRIESFERFNAALAEKYLTRASVDERLVEALDALATVGLLREQVTAEAAAVRKSAEQAGHLNLQHRDQGYVSPPVRAAIEKVPFGSEVRSGRDDDRARPGSPRAGSPLEVACRELAPSALTRAAPPLTRLLRRIAARFAA